MAYDTESPDSLEKEVFCLKPSRAIWICRTWGIGHSRGPRSILNLCKIGLFQSELRAVQADCSRCTRNSEKRQKFSAAKNMIIIRPRTIFRGCRFGHKILAFSNPISSRDQLIFGGWGPKSVALATGFGGGKKTTSARIF